MINFLMLGQIPGTSVQINFLSWLIIAAGLLIYGALRYDREHDHRPRLIVLYSVRYAWLVTKLKYIPRFRARAVRLTRRTVAILRAGIAAAWSAVRQRRAAADGSQM